MRLQAIGAGFITAILMVTFQAGSANAQHHGGGGGHGGGGHVGGGHVGGGHVGGGHVGGGYHAGAYHSGGLYHAGGYHGGNYHNHYPGLGLYYGLGVPYAYPYTTYDYPDTSYDSAPPVAYDVPPVDSYYPVPAASYSVPPPAEPSAIEAAQLRSTQTSNLDISDTAFGQLVVNRGTKVTWTNQGKGSHTITSSQGLWDSGPIPSGYVYDCTFTQPGTFPFYDKSNPNLRGEIIVR
jgi:plastocyanin